MGKSKKKHDEKRERRNIIARLEDRMQNIIPSGYHRCTRCFGTGKEFIITSQEASGFKRIICRTCNGRILIPN